MRILGKSKTLSLKSQLKKLVTGLTVPQEYCCLELENFQHPLSVFLTLRNQDFRMEVTQSHLFLGYKPLIIGLPFAINGQDYKTIKEQPQICLSFGQVKFETNAGWHDFPTNQTSVARLVLRKVGEKTMNEQAVLLYEGDYGAHSFLNSIKQFVNRQRGKLQKQLPNNINLPGNLLDRVRIAYAVPRVISIITVSDGSLINMFPTDLHGPVGDEGYISSLRIGGMANDQVEKYKRIVISEVEASSYKETYALGKNHMAMLQEEKRFSLHQERSEVFIFPLPGSVVRYRELKQIDSSDHGIHRIHLYEVVHRKVMRQNITTLGHIHQYYAQWRQDHSIPTNILFR